MKSIPIVFLYQDKYYKASVEKIPGAPVQYELTSADPPLRELLPRVFVSDPPGNRLRYHANELNHAIALALVESCELLDEPLHS